MFLFVAFPLAPFEKQDVWRAGGNFIRKIKIRVEEQNDFMSESAMAGELKSFPKR